MQERNKNNIKAITIKDLKQDIDFKKIKSSGIDGVVLNVPSGLSNKPLLKQYKKAKEIGLLVGFSYEFNEQKSSNLQGFLFCNSIKNKAMDIYPTIEIKSNKGNLSKKDYSDKCLKFLSMIKKNIDIECIIKADLKFSNENLDIRFRKNMFWAVDLGKSKPENSTIWVEWTCFAYGNVTVKGINDKCTISELNPIVVIGSCKCGHCQKDGGKDHDHTKPTDGCKGLNDHLYEYCIQGEIVRELQEQLNIQFKEGIPVNGCFTEVTLKACINVARGARGPITKIIQTRLEAKGFSVGKAGIDGIYLNDTIKAVKEFQKANGIKPTGVVSTKTWEALFKK